MNKHLGPIALSLTLLGAVGGVAAAKAFQPIEKEPTRVEVVQPAAETVTVEPTVEPSPTVAPKPVVKKAPAKVAPVESSPAPAPEPSTVQRQVTVSEPQPEPETTPVPDATPPAGSAFDSMEDKKKNPPPPVP